jgi:hypothetical protein
MDKMFKGEKKDLGGIQKLQEKFIKDDYKDLDTYGQMQQDLIDNNQEMFKTDYITDYGSSFTDMTENITSVWSAAQGLMTAAGINGETQRYASIIGYGIKAVSAIMMIAKGSILADAYRGAAAAYAAMAGIPIVGPALGAVAAAVTFAAISAFGLMGGVTSGIATGGGSPGLAASPGMESTGGGYTEGYHTGGMVGYSVAHAGLMVDERMIKAQVGEGIIKRSTMDLYSRKGISFDMLNNGMVGGESVSSDNSTNIDKIAVSVNINNPPKDFNADKLAKQLVPALQKQIKLNRLRVPTK